MIANPPSTRKRESAPSALVPMRARLDQLIVNFCSGEARPPAPNPLLDNVPNIAPRGLDDHVRGRYSSTDTELPPFDPGQRGGSRG